MGILEEGRPCFFSLPFEKTRIDFFVLRSGGEIQSYLDACSRCYPKKRGFRPFEGRLYCRACGESYPIDSLKGVGSCYPLQIKGRTEGGKYIIMKEDLIKSKRYFD